MRTASGDALVTNYPIRLREIAAGRQDACILKRLDALRLRHALIRVSARVNASSGTAKDDEDFLARMRRTAMLGR